jgi:hypothetical protein
MPLGHALSEHEAGDIPVTAAAYCRQVASIMRV